MSKTPMPAADAPTEDWARYANDEHQVFVGGDDVNARDIQRALAADGVKGLPAPPADADLQWWADYARTYGVVVSQGYVTKAGIVRSLRDEGVEVTNARGVVNVERVPRTDLPDIPPDLDEVAVPGDPR
jgi:hypothetical protein